MNTTKPKATPQRVLFEIVNFLLVLSFTIPVGAFAEQFFHILNGDVDVASRRFD